MSYKYSENIRDKTIKNKNNDFLFSICITKIFIYIITFLYTYHIFIYKISHININRLYFLILFAIRKLLFKKFHNLLQHSTVEKMDNALKFIRLGLKYEMLEECGNYGED